MLACVCTVHLSRGRAESVGSAIAKKTFFQNYLPIGASAVRARATRVWADAIGCSDELSALYELPGCLDVLLLLDTLR